MGAASVINQREGLRTRPEVLLGVILLGSLILRIWLILADGLPFNADEAIVALMGRHIRLGQELPIFFYGQAYMSSLDAVFIAVGFNLLGEHVWVIRLIQALLYQGVILTSFLLAKNISNSSSVGLLTAILLMIPNVNVTLYTSVSLGGYGEALLIGNLILLQALKLRQIEAPQENKIAWMWFGALVGFGFWVFGLTLIYSAAAVLYLVWKLNIDSVAGRHRISMTIWFWFFMGTLVGLLPVVLFGIQNGIGAVISEFLGSAISGVSNGAFVERFLQNLIGLLLLGFPVILGIRPPWEVRWLILPLIPFVLFFWGIVIREYTRQNSAVRHNLLDGGALIILVCLINLFGFLLTPFGSDPSGRYFLPLTIMLTLFAGSVIYQLGQRWQPWLWILPLILLFYHFAGLVDSIYLRPYGLTTQFDAVTRIQHEQDDELIQFLTSKGVTRGYSNYWVAYPLAFLSAEEIVFVPALPYHQDFRYTTRDNRYAPYNRLVADAENIAYITTFHEPLNQHIRTSFTDLSVDWDEIVIGDYHIFYNLSRPVRPNEIGLGTTQ